MASKVRFCPSRSCAAVRPESELDEPSRSRRLDNARHAHAAAQKPARPGAVRRDDHARPGSRTWAPACPAAYPPQLACTSPTPTPPPAPPPLVPAATLWGRIQRPAGTVVAATTLPPPTWRPEQVN
jgi:hypothetical protein